MKEERKKIDGYLNEEHFAISLRRVAEFHMRLTF